MPVENAEVARLFRETADLLDLSGANAFRVRAYRNAARTVEELPQPVEELVRGNGKRLPRFGTKTEAKLLRELSARSADQGRVLRSVAVAELGFMQWGVDQARRGWAERKDVANTRPLAQLLKLLHRGRRAA